MRIILLRHGRTTANAEHRFNGQTDEALCAAGREDALRAGVCDAVNCVFVSPLLRARETASICAPNAEQIVRPDLSEMSFGAFEGKTADELSQNADYIAWIGSDRLLPCPQGEDILSFQARVCKAFLEAYRTAVDAEMPDMLVVAHGGTIMALLDRFARPHRAYYEWAVDNACGYTCNADTDDDGALILTDCRYFTRLPLASVGG